MSVHLFSLFVCVYFCLANRICTIFLDSTYQLAQFSCSVVSDSLQPMNCKTPGFPIYHQLLEVLKHMSIEPVMQFNHLILCHPFLLLPSTFPSIRVFSSELAFRFRWPKYWSFSISPSNDAIKVLHLICQQIWKFSSDHRTGKGQFSFQSQRKAMPKNVQITIQLHSFHMLASLCSKSF